MRRINLPSYLIPILLILILPGCKAHTIVDYKNPDDVVSKEVSEEIRKKYSVDGVLFRPLILYKERKNKKDVDYCLRVDAYTSEPETIEVEIKKVSLTLDGKLIVLKSTFSNRIIDDFNFNDYYQTYSADIWSPPFTIKSPKDKKKLHMILYIEVKKGDKTLKSGSVEATFEANNRTYVFPQV